MSYSQLVLSEKPLGYWDCSLIESGSLSDLTSYNNDATLNNAFTDKKPIIYGPSSSVMLLEDSTIEIENVYNMFISGSEEKNFSIDFFFSILNSSTTPHKLLQIGNFIECYVISDRIYLKSGDQVASVKVKNWENTQYVCIRYGSGSLSLNLNNSGNAAINLGDQFKFTDTTPPSLVFGPSAEYNSPLYINAIAIYGYSLILSEMLMRQSWSMYDSKSERLAIANNADIINPSIDGLTPNFSYSIDTSQRFLEGEGNNIVYKENYITLPSEPPVTLQSLNKNIQYDINLDGLSLSDDTYINLENSYKYFSGDFNIIRQQVELDGLSTKQTIFHIGPMMDRSSIQLYKSDSNTIVLESITSSGSAETISESDDLGSNFDTPFDIAVYFIEGYVTLAVNGVEQSPELSSSPSPGFDFYLGNSFSLDSPLTSRIKNFSIDRYEDGQEIVFTNVGNYTLKFNSSFSVSQYGSWNYQIKIPDNSVTGLVNYNYASKNCNLYVNDAFIQETSLIPNVSYGSENIINVEVELKTDDSFTNPAVFSGVSILTYDSSYISSSNGRYRISPLNKKESEAYVSTDPFLIRLNRVPAINRPINLGIKFKAVLEEEGDYLGDLEATSWTSEQIQITSGAELIINSDSGEIAILEFLIKLDRVPSVGESFIVFDIEGQSIDLKYSDSGLELSSGYILYVDGQEATEGQELEEFEFYHFLIKFDTEITSTIRLGVNNERTIGLDGSMGFFAVHSSVPAEFSSYVSSRYNSIIGRPVLSKTDPDSLEITDMPQASQVSEYSQDGKYFAMKELPKIKIVQNKWQTVK
jgi:hypothetical protein